ncbi:hypothetical protein HAX54_014562 [Datura stramonium]|uniref:Uncharacterized protein n=1 Tax=Datura stramonium TaxID=4076 RepID=A0ABS8TN99_DATST|nr:hypothetical protein [Datura stramonium]
MQPKDQILTDEPPSRPAQLRFLVSPFYFERFHDLEIPSKGRTTAGRRANTNVEHQQIKRLIVYPQQTEDTKLESSLEKESSALEREPNQLAMKAVIGSTAAGPYSSRGCLDLPSPQSVHLPRGSRLRNGST